jgi:hypothetical protein
MSGVGKNTVIQVLSAIVAIGSYFIFEFVATQITLQSRANHLLGLYRMAALTELAHISSGGFLLTTRFPDFYT